MIKQWESWQSCRPFKNIFKAISVDMVINMYPTFHEADISKFTAAMNERMTKFDIKIVLARWSKNMGIA